MNVLSSNKRVQTPCAVYVFQILFSPFALTFPRNGKETLKLLLPRGWALLPEI